MRIPTIISLTVSVVVVLLTPACLSTIPSDDSVLTAEISQAIGHPVADDVVGKGTWYPNAQGFAVLKSLTPASQVGVIAVEPKRISFLQWNDTQSRFNVLRSISCVNAKQVFLDKLGVARMLVVEGPDGTFDAFEFTRGLGMVGNATLAEQAFSRIEAGREQSTR